MATTREPVVLTDRQQELWRNSLAHCESEIERAFLSAYLVLLDKDAMKNMAIGEPSETVVSCTLLGADVVVTGLFDEDPSLNRVDAVVMQAEVGPFRPDFILWRTFVDPAGGDPIASPKAIVECDGHDFHDRTKEQAARDKSRDRYLQTQGFYVLRFTGSELWQGAERCAREADTFLKDGAYRVASERHKFPM